MARPSTADTAPSGRAGLLRGDVAVAHAFGLRWKACNELRAVEEGCGINVAAFNGDASWTLTMPARYIVAPGGTIEYADINVDYTLRGDPSELIRSSPTRRALARLSEAPESVSVRPNQ